MLDSSACKFDSSRSAFTCATSSRAQDARLLQLLNRAFGSAPPARLPHAHSFVLTLKEPRLEHALTSQPRVRFCDSNLIHGVAPHLWSLRISACEQPHATSERLFSLSQLVDHHIDAIELRVDLLHSLECLEVQRQLGLLRCHSSLPIIFTLRTTASGGAFSGSDEEYVALIEIGAVR